MREIIDHIKSKKKIVSEESQKELDMIEEMIIETYRIKLKNKKEELINEMKKAGPEIFIFKYRYEKFKTETQEIRNVIDDLSEYEMPKKSFFENYQII